jgi:hypothetical protein
LPIHSSAHSLRTDFDGFGNFSGIGVCRLTPPEGLGRFTTFSAFGYETFVLLRDRPYLAAGANTVSNVLFGIVAVYLVGWQPRRWLFRVKGT